MVKKLVKDFVSKPIKKETIEIKYSTTGYDNYPCAATSFYQEETFSGVGLTFDEAKKELLIKVKIHQATAKIIIPPNETIEL